MASDLVELEITTSINRGCGTDTSLSKLLNQDSKDANIRAAVSCWSHQRRSLTHLRYKPFNTLREPDARRHALDIGSSCLADQVYPYHGTRGHDPQKTAFVWITRREPEMVVRTTPEVRLCTCSLTTSRLPLVRRRSSQPNPHDA